MAKSQVFRVTKNTAPLQRIRKALNANARDLVIGLATGMEEYYRDNAPRDTGSMAETVHVKMKDGTYQHGNKTAEGAVVAQARALNPKAKVVYLPNPTNDTTAYVAPIVEHWQVNEFGSRNRAARPTLTQARAHVQGQLMTKYKHLFEKVVTDGQK